MWPPTTASNSGSSASINSDVQYGEETELNGYKLLPFTDFEGQRLALMSDEGGEVTIPAGNPWEHSTVPAEHQILGLGAVSITTGRPNETLRMSPRSWASRSSPMNRALSIRIIALCY